MRIALIGATGFIGSSILSESLQRGHDVTAIVRSTGDFRGRPGLTTVQGDVTNPDRLAQLLAGHDVVISAFNPGKDATGTGAKSIIAAAKRSRVPRLLVVGGAGTLEVAPGQRLVDQPNFPQEWKEGALRTADVLDQLRAEQELDWVFVSPAAISRLLESKPQREAPCKYAGWAGQVRRLNVTEKHWSSTTFRTNCQWPHFLRGPDEPFPASSRPGSTAAALLTHLHADHADPDALAVALRVDAPILRPEPARATQPMWS